MVRGRPKKSSNVECICRGCGKKFMLADWAVAKMGRGKFCSRSCYLANVGMRCQRSTLAIDPEPKKCELCNKEFFVGGEGRPKRKQRFCSMSCATNAKYAWGILKGGSKKGRMINHDKGYFAYLRASKHPTNGDIRQVAGFYEGEGWSILLKNKDGSPKTQEVCIGQKDRWTLDQLRELFGGYVTNQGIYQTGQYKGRHRGYTWAIHGPPRPRLSHDHLQFPVPAQTGQDPGSPGGLNAK